MNVIVVKAMSGFLNGLGKGVFIPKPVNTTLVNLDHQNRTVKRIIESYQLKSKYIRSYLSIVLAKVASTFGRLVFSPGSTSI